MKDMEMGLKMVLLVVLDELVLLPVTHTSVESQASMPSLPLLKECLHGLNDGDNRIQSTILTCNSSTLSFLVDCRLINEYTVKIDVHLDDNSKVSRIDREGVFLDSLVCYQFKYANANRVSTAPMTTALKVCSSHINKLVPHVTLVTR